MRGGKERPAGPGAMGEDDDGPPDDTNEMSRVSSILQVCARRRDTLDPQGVVPGVLESLPSSCRHGPLHRMCTSAFNVLMVHLCRCMKHFLPALTPKQPAHVINVPLIHSYRVGGWKMCRMIGGASGMET